MGWEAELKQRILREYGSVRAYAKYRAGRRASHETIESRRRQISKWVNEGTMPDPENQARLTVDFNLPEGFFPTPQRRSRTIAELAAKLDLLDSLQAQLEEIVAAQRVRLDEHHERLELLEQRSQRARRRNAP